MTGRRRQCMSISMSLRPLIRKTVPMCNVFAQCLQDLWSVWACERGACEWDWWLRCAEPLMPPPELQPEPSPFAKPEHQNRGPGRRSPPLPPFDTATLLPNRLVRSVFPVYEESTLLSALDACQSHFALSQWLEHG